MVLQRLRMRYHHVRDALRTTGMRETLHDVLYLRREAVPMELELSRVKPVKPPAQPEPMELLELTPESFDGAMFEYPEVNRRYKARANLAQGYHGFAVAQGRRMLGDVWCAFPNREDPRAAHPDLAWLGNDFGANDVYMFDMYVSPEARGKAAASLLFGGAMNLLKNRGCDKVHCYVLADRLPAMWLHRTMGFRELGRLVIRRLFVVRTVRRATSG